MGGYGGRRVHDPYLVPPTGRTGGSGRSLVCGRSHTYTGSGTRLPLLRPDPHVQLQAPGLSEGLFHCRLISGLPTPCSQHRETPSEGPPPPVPFFRATEDRPHRLLPLPTARPHSATPPKYLGIPFSPNRDSTLGHLSRLVSSGTSQSVTLSEWSGDGPLT